MDSSSSAPKMRTMEPTSPLDILPANAVDEILVRLPIRDAVRTSALSRWWRNRWHSIPDLVLRGSRGTSLPAAAVVDRVLLLHSAPVRRFSLSTAEAASRADPWLLSLSRRGARTLTSVSLSFSLNHNPFLHSSVFSFRALTSLALSYCSLSPPPPDRFSGFPALRSLRLDTVRFRHDRQLPALLSGSPALEKLTLKAVTPCGRLCIPNPNLRYLDLQADCDGIALAGGQTLGTLCVHLYSSHTDVGLAQLFRGVVCNGMLRLDVFACLALVRGGIPESVSTSFQQLRSLSIMVNLMDRRHASLMLCLMKSSSNLHQLYLLLSIVGTGYPDHETRPDADFWKTQQGLELFSSLRTVEILDIMFEDAEMEFMRFILARARVLETLTIISYSGTAKSHESALTELWMFHRASPSAEIIYEANDDEDGTDDEDGLDN